MLDGPQAAKAVISKTVNTKRTGIRVPASGKSSGTGRLRWVQVHTTRFRTVGEWIGDMLEWHTSPSKTM